jgi:hypothetical protein
MVLGSWDPGSPEISEFIAQEKARTDELIDEGVVQQLSLRAANLWNSSRDGDRRIGWFS